jgi:protein CpxP
MSQTRYRWMLFLVIILVASNILLGYLLMQSGNQPVVKKRKANDVSAWYAEVGLEQEQIDTFKILKEEYFKDMKPLWSDIRQLKDSLYLQLDKSLEDSTAENILLMISKKNLEADSRTYMHFTKLRKFCTPEQQARFDTIIPKLINRTGRRR